MDPSVISRTATDQDLEAVTETLTLAFADDPVWGGWAFPDRSRADAQRRIIFGLWLESVLRLGWIRVTPTCEAVAAWVPPGQVEITADEKQRIASAAERLLGDHAGVFQEGADLFEATHPKKPHYYLGLLGTRPDHRGKGLGMALLRENLARIDTEAMPAYLESTNPVNLFRYERLGFARVGGFTLPGGPTVDTMWREAPLARTHGRAGQSTPERSPLSG